MRLQCLMRELLNAFAHTAVKLARKDINAVYILLVHNNAYMI